MAAITYFLILALISKEIVAWTIDLPEARKYFFEKNDKYEHKRKDNTEKVVYAKTNDTSGVDKKDFDNIVGDSPANTKDKYFEQDYYRNGEYKRPEMVEEDDSSDENGVYPEKYADEYGYQSYMEKKVAHIVHNGTVYLEGLRRALEQYGELLQNCSRNNSSRSNFQPASSFFSSNSSFTPSSSFNSSFPLSSFTNSSSQSSSFTNFSSPSPSLSTPSSSFSSPSSSSSTSSTNSSSSSAWLPQNESPEIFRSESEDERCERATRESEHIRRLAALALWATRELQDKAYAEKYDKDLDELHEEEEKELLLRLAWFLDRLAYFTGYEPNAEDFISPSTPRTTTPSIRPLALTNSNAFLTVFQPMSVTREQTNAMMNCLGQDSDQPAADRCKFPLQMPEEIARLMNSQDGSSAVSRTARSDSIETLAQAESADPARAKSVKKRSINDSPLVNIMKYYAKFKSWTNSNQEQKTKDVEDSADNESFEENLLTANARNIKKRAIDAKKSMIHNSLKQEDPMQDISQHIKHKSGVHYVKDDIEEEKIKMYLEKIRHSDRVTAKALVKRFQKQFKPVKKRSVKKRSMVKRSVKYYRKFQPAPAQDPQQDISYYVKNRRGTNYNYNQVQARQVRAGLEQIFQTGNIEVVRRYGSNYNPAVPNTLVAGGIRTMADF